MPFDLDPDALMDALICTVIAAFFLLAVYSTPNRDD